MDNLNKLINQQNFLGRANLLGLENGAQTQETDNNVPFLSKNISILGLKIPYWMIICCIIIIILLVLFMIPDSSASPQQIVKPDYEILVSSDSPINTVVDRILKPYPYFNY